MDKVVILFESDGITRTPNNLFISDNYPFLSRNGKPELEDCFNKIDELKLDYTYFSGDTKQIIFSNGIRTIKDV